MSQPDWFLNRSRAGRSETGAKSKGFNFGFLGQGPIEEFFYFFIYKKKKRVKKYGILLLNLIININEVAAGSINTGNKHEFELRTNK